MPSMFRIEDDSAFPAPAAVYNWRVYLLAVSAAMGSSMFGYDSAFIGGSLTLPSFKSRFGLNDQSSAKTDELSANIVSTFQAGCFFGAIIVYYFSERVGRRISLMACGCLFDLGAILQLASNGRVGMIYGGRALTGLAVGASSLMVPQYISEWSPPAIRGRLIGTFEMVQQLSQVVGYWVNYGVNSHISPTSDAQWHIPFSLQLVPGALLVIMMAFQPESPRWLIKAGKSSKARARLSRIRNLPEADDYISWEVEAIQEQLEREAEAGADRTFWGKLKETFAPGVRERVIMGMTLMMLQNLSGINALNYYSPNIFKSIGFTGTSIGLLATGVFGIVKCAVTILFMLFGIDRLGRRNAMLIGSAGAMVAMFYLASYSKVSGSFAGTASRDAGAYVAIVMIYLFAVFYAMSWNGIPWIFCAEVFPTAIRSVCLVFTTCVQWLGQFIIVYSTPYMIRNITYGTYLFFAASLALAMVIVYLYMPETKGFSLEEMDVLFSTKGLAITQRKKAERIIAEQRAAVDVVEDEKSTPEHVESISNV